MRVVREYMRTPPGGMFRKLWKRQGRRARWVYWAQGYYYGLGKTARAAQHDARRGKSPWI